MLSNPGQVSVTVGEQAMLEELLAAIREQTHKGSIALASSYLKAMDTCLGDEWCARQYLDGIDTSKWQEAVAKADSQLTYHDPAMDILGGYEIAPQRKWGRFHKKRRDTAPGSVMEFDCVMTSTRKDHDGDILHSDGAEIDPKMPLLWQHMPMAPIGKYVETLAQTARKVTVACAIADTPLGRDAAVLVEFGGLRISHGFIPTDYEPLKRPKDDASQERYGYRVRKFKVLEISLVSVPANQDAVVTAFSREKLHHPMVKSWAASIAASRKQTIPVALRDGITIPVTIDITTKTHDCSCGTEGSPILDKDVILDGKPMANFHACRLVDPGKFETGSFRTVSRDHEGKKYSIIMGKQKGSDKMSEQSYRYAKEVWSPEQAKSHCKSHDGILFEPAKDADPVIKGRVSQDDLNTLKDAMTHCKDAMNHEGCPKSAQAMISHASTQVGEVVKRHSGEKSTRAMSKSDMGKLSDAAEHMDAAAGCDGMPSPAKTCCKAGQSCVKGVMNRHAGADLEADSEQAAYDAGATMLASRMMGMLLTGKAVHPGILAELTATCQEALDVARNKSVSDYLQSK